MFQRMVSLVRRGKIGVFNYGRCVHANNNFAIASQSRVVLITPRLPSQLDDLVAQLSETEPHYIKCIKPNADKAPGGWAGPLVIEQLRYSGVLEVRRSLLFRFFCCSELQGLPT